MSILIDRNTRVLVQGITGRDGSFHAKGMLDYGTNVVGGVTPGKGGEQVHGLPVFNSVKEAVAATKANATVIYVPAKFAAAAIREAIDASVPLIIAITEGVPTLDMMDIYHQVRERGLRLIGPNCPGVITPGQCKIGIMPGYIHAPGRVGVISRSGTLTYEIVFALTNLGVGQSTCIGIGGDPIVGSGPMDLLPLFERDPDTDAIVLVGEIGGDEEERTAAFIREHIKKPVFSYIVGRTAPEGKRMGHAGAIVSGGAGTAESKIKAFAAAGVPVADTIDQLAEAVAAALKA
ncbi:MAG: succinate--CoA ligase subunit alpha [Kiritimatiellae bacterium]|nr:succinate--CoA ligase subunit alpha [Kiritimatiellia bacterium]MCO5043755.1 succinate--CoA ligase subunit alpha [Kiritimatiellia bacterium]MCO5062305.1 succinate--CoA ligase subunit alpha [Kiritimatiellia bacterium]MCO5067153.1 succinate--CoA ligase subunit alpha [Kiritimatiellia bacterium]MCO6401547.1 succinate--CoA ligase subunit alpha [Verrucomicrobiota bacterium]